MAESVTSALKLLSIFVLNRSIRNGGGLTIVEINEDATKNYYPIGNGDANKYLLVVKDPTFWWKVITQGEVGLGESYAAGHWSLQGGDLGEFFMMLANENMNKSSFDKIKWLFPTSWFSWFKFSSMYQILDQAMAKDSIKVSYDVGNDFFQAFLDDSMTYTSAKWANPQDSLFEAQHNKRLTLIEKSLVKNLKKPRVLDIGCGWGGLLNHVKTECGDADCVGLTNSPSMASFSAAQYKDVTFVESDYRDYVDEERFDAILSVEMIEAIGVDQFPVFASVCDRLTKSKGRVVLQVITGPAYKNPTTRQKKKKTNSTFVTTHIFPGGQIPHVEFVHEAMGEYFKLVHSESFGHDYERTLRLWRQKLMKNSTELEAKYGKETVNGYDYYLSWCEAGFHSEMLNVHQLVFEKK